MTQIAHTGETPSNTPPPQKMLTTAEKFELLSAYMDDEVTEEERSVVEQWLDSDVQIQTQYQAQLKLRAAMKTLSSDLFPSDADFPDGQSHQKSPLSLQNGLPYECSRTGTGTPSVLFGGGAFYKGHMQ